MRTPAPYPIALLAAVLTLLAGLVVQQLVNVNARLDRLERQPVERVVVHTITRDVSLPARASRSMSRRPLVGPSAAATPETSRRMSVTAYCATGNRTASGVWPSVGMAATLDRNIKFGTKLKVPGFGVVTVTDRIGHGSQLDLFLGAGAACEREAREWGRRSLLVEVVR